MAIFTILQLAAARQIMQISGLVNHPKPSVNAATQAVEDWFQGQQTALSTAIDVATAPVLLTAAEKKLVVRAYLSLRFKLGI